MSNTQIKLSTHRLIQIHSLEDDLSSRARVYSRAHQKAISRNGKAAMHFLALATQCERIAAKCRQRLATQS